MDCRLHSRKKTIEVKFKKLSISCGKSSSDESRQESRKKNFWKPFMASLVKFVPREESSWANLLSARRCFLYNTKKFLENTSSNRSTPPRCETFTPSASLRWKH